jgi:hypothetical protein
MTRVVGDVLGVPRVQVDGVETDLFRLPDVLVLGADRCVVRILDGRTRRAGVLGAQSLS